MDNLIANFDELENHFNAMTSEILPYQFHQGLTTTKFLQELFTYVKNIVNNQDAINEDLSKKFDEKFDELAKELKEDTSFFEKYRNQIKDFCLKNITDLIGGSLKYITFGINDDGYFVATIPPQWQNLSFDCCVDTTSEDYGKIEIRY